MKSKAVHNIVSDMWMTLAPGCDNYPRVSSGQTSNYRHRVITVRRDLWLLPWPGSSPVPGPQSSYPNPNSQHKFEIRIHPIVLSKLFHLKMFGWQKICFHPAHLLLWTFEPNEKFSQAIHGAGHKCISRECFNWMQISQHLHTSRYRQIY